MLKFKHDENGFTVGDTVSGKTSYAYPTSPHWEAAKRKPERVAAEMIFHEREFAPFVHPKVDVEAYNSRNWETLGGRS